MFRLFLTFFKIGLFTFGGGYAMLPLLQDEIVRRNRWASDEELMDYYSVGQCTPGIIAVNVATFIGYKLHGWFGGVMATVAIILPSFIIICLIAAILLRFMHNTWLIHAFAGIRIVVAALIFNTLIDMWRKGVNGIFGYIVFALTLGGLLCLNLSAIWAVIAAGCAGFLYACTRRRLQK